MDEGLYVAFEDGHLFAVSDTREGLQQAIAIEEQRRRENSITLVSMWTIEFNQPGTHPRWYDDAWWKPVERAARGRVAA